jgi:hypothetical protein
MKKRKPLLSPGLVLVALGVGYLLLHREPVYGCRLKSWWEEHVADLKCDLIGRPCSLGPLNQRFCCGGWK